jgi:hypothetical protein
LNVPPATAAAVKAFLRAKAAAERNAAVSISQLQGEDGLLQITRLGSGFRNNNSYNSNR